MKTTDELGIFWAAEDGHIEVSGINFYGYWGQAKLPDEISSLGDLLKNIDAEFQIQKIEADEGNFLMLPVWIKTWPSDIIWRQTVEEILNTMVLMGATVSWSGDEYCSCSLTELDPATSGGCVYAASSRSTGLLLHSDLSEEISYLSDDELQRLLL
ncbi:hypothetical protein [uncultured Gimesia sp.]|uniref:hypothetical protein n=1 Tax=uncultured Gimesia sp. TaxID=1678688 RepID=UPI0030DD3910|tara:strand:+ start:10776 stop:11243 length:468 start_codon:yes stop_codon:yes gene_type:complete